MRQNVSMSVLLPRLPLESCPFQGVSYLGQGRLAMQEWWGWGGVSGAVLVNGWQVMRSPFHLYASLTAAMVSATSALTGHGEGRCVGSTCQLQRWLLEKVLLSSALSFSLTPHFPSRDSFRLHSEKRWNQYPWVGCARQTWPCHNPERFLGGLSCGCLWQAACQRVI